jgi:hypothetical protein
VQGRRGRRAPLRHAAERQLTERGATAAAPRQTAPDYRLFALPGTTPPKPGLVRVAPGTGRAPSRWRSGTCRSRTTAASSPDPAAAGHRHAGLADGAGVQGFVCEPSSRPGRAGHLASRRLARLPRGPSNAKFVLDEFIVAKDSPIKTMADLKGKRVASAPASRTSRWPRPCWSARAPHGDDRHRTAHRPARGRARGRPGRRLYTLEPTGTVGRMNGTTRVSKAGVVAKYILGDPMAPWHGGAASLTTEFIKKNPDVAKKYIAAYARGVELVRKKPDEARQFMKGYTAIEGALTAEVPLSPRTCSTTSSSRATSPTSRSSTTCSPRRASSRRR